MDEKNNFDCGQLEEALREETPELMAALERHAAGCAACGEELRAWREISAAAHAMQKSWPSPALWPRIAGSLQAEIAKPRGWRAWLGIPGGAPALRWQVALATLTLLVVSSTGGWLWMHRIRSTAPDNQHLLTDQAVREVEQNEINYEKSIEKLAKLAAPKLEQASTPLLVNYKEKLALIDSAINDCRTNLDKNRANAYLRSELLSMYREKERTLTDLLREN